MMQRKKTGKVLKLFISQAENRGRVEQSQISLDTNGVLGDKFYAKDPERSVLITSQESYIMAKEHAIDMGYGELGENIIVDFNPYSLPKGHQIEIGDTLLEISQHCTLCKSLSKIDNHLPKLLKNDRGVFAKVLKAGKIEQASKVLY